MAALLDGRSKAWLVACALILPALAGCLTADDPEPLSDREVSLDIEPASPTDRDRGDDEYWMIWVHGDQQTIPDPGVRCIPPGNSQVQMHNQSLAYAWEDHPIRPEQLRIAVAFHHLKATGCAVATRLVTNPTGEVHQDMSVFGNLTLSVAEDGDLVVGGRDVPLGQAAVASYEVRDAEAGETVEGTFRVENLGAWDQSDAWCRGC